MGLPFPVLPLPGRLPEMPDTPRVPDDRRPSRGPIRVFRLGEEPGDDLSAATTPEERIAMVWELTRRMWEFTGGPAPIPRERIPIRIVRPG